MARDTVNGEEKFSLRRAMKERLAGIDPVARAAASRVILQHVRDLVPSEGLVLAYEPLPDEPDISPLIEELQARGRLALVVGRGDGARVDPAGPIALALVPGRAFSRDGLRLGRGGGTFDRILGELACPRVGVAFACQVLDVVPAEPHDVRMDRVITELQEPAR